VYKTFISSLCNLLQSPVTSSFLGPNILLNPLVLHDLFPFVRVYRSSSRSSQILRNHALR
jgi:hypothetical protein